MKFFKYQFSSLDYSLNLEKEREKKKDTKYHKTCTCMFWIIIKAKAYFVP